MDGRGQRLPTGALREAEAWRTHHHGREEVEHSVVVVDALEHLQTHNM